MACKLYIRTAAGDNYMGKFKNREKAEEFFLAWINSMPCFHGTSLPVPIYVETGRKR